MDEDDEVRWEMPMRARILRLDWKSSHGDGGDPPSTNLKRMLPESHGWWAKGDFWCSV